VLFAIVKGEALLWGDRTVGAIFAKLPAVLVGAAVVSVLEEVVFRGILLHRLQRYLPAVAAAVLTSVMYAAVHFITPVKSFTYDHYSWSAGFVYLGVVVERIVSPGTFPAFIGLVLVGMVLAWVMIRSRSIYACIGLHTGWIVAVKMTGYTTVVRPGYVFSPGAGQRYYLVSEPIAWVSILAVGAIMVRVLAWISARGCGTLPSPGGCGMLRVNGAEVTNGMTSSR
jgi:uncharacterized protein